MQVHSKDNSEKLGETPSILESYSSILDLKVSDGVIVDIVEFFYFNINILIVY